MKKIIIILFSVISSSGYCDTPKPDLFWKARGLQAIEKIATIEKSLKGAKPSKAKFCELRLEEFYKSYTDPGRSKLLHESKSGVEIFKIVFIDDNQKAGDGLTMINLIYPKKSFVPAGVVVVALGDSWAAGFHTESLTFNVNGNGCSFSFPLKDPLSGTSEVQKN